MFGLYDFPLSKEQEGIFLSVTQRDGNFFYERNCMDETVEKMILANDQKILINPVEPLNKPKAISSNLFVDLDTALMIQPKATKKIYLTFPIEIGVYISRGGDFQILDIFTLSKQKFILYGDPKNGVICKYWKSGLFSEIPAKSPIREGVLELQISNPNSHWVEVSKAIFNAYGMKIYYNKKMVSMKAQMKLRNGDLAETDFKDSPLEKKMKKSLEIYTARKLSVGSTKFVMEFGL